MQDLVVEPASSFVGRNNERERLDEALKRARAGTGELLLLAGSAGTGKTALIQDFLAGVENDGKSNTVIMRTRCSYQTGSQDAYSPFRNLIEDLLVRAAEVTVDTTDRVLSTVRRVGVAAARALLEVAPDLLGSLIPGSGLAWRAGQKLIGEFIPKDASSGPRDVPERISIHEQYLAVLNQISEKHSVLIVVEDLHWADRSSLDMLSFLVGRIRSLKILLIGSYRPDELSMDAQNRVAPLEKIEREARGNGIGQVIDLSGLTRDDVQAYIGIVFPGNGFEPDFLDWIYRRTEGNPLFAVQILRQMQEIGHLDNASGQWIESPSISRPDYLPGSVEAVIEDRIQRLEPRWLKLLSCGSIQGTEFSAQVVASVCDDDDAQVIDELVYALQRRLDLVEERGERALASRQILSLFHFTHSAIPKYLYEQYLVSAQRRRLHGKVGQALEQLHRDYADLIAPVLAYHFIEAHEDERAVHYLLVAADRALSVRALPEARDLFRRAASIAGDSMETELLSEIGRLATSDRQPLARICVLRWVAALFGEGDRWALPNGSDGARDQASFDSRRPSEGWRARVERFTTLLGQLIAAVEPLLRENNAEADATHQVVLRVLMFLSESAISRDDAVLYTPIAAVNELVTTYFDARDDTLSSAFRLSYLAWIAEILELPPEDLKKAAVRASNQYHQIYSDDISEATNAIEAAAFNAWRAGSHDKAARYYIQLYDLLGFGPATANARIAHGWFGAQNCAWACEGQPAPVDEEVRADLHRSGAGLFASVADELTRGDKPSLSAPALCRRALQLLSGLGLLSREDVDLQTRLTKALADVEERNQAFPESIRQAAIVGETYDGVASAENPFADRLLNWLRSQQVECVRERPKDSAALNSLSAKYKLIIVQSGPRSRSPHGRFVFEIFSDVPEFDKLYLLREPFCGHWAKDHGGSTWLLVAGNGTVRTMDAVDQLLSAGVLPSILASVYGSEG
jgi:hypothetical protein